MVLQALTAGTTSFLDPHRILGKSLNISGLVFLLGLVGRPYVSNVHCSMVRLLLPALGDI